MNSTSEPEPYVGFTTPTVPRHVPEDICNLHSEFWMHPIAMLVADDPKKQERNGSSIVSTIVGR
jgi:hypothetical protein